MKITSVNIDEITSFKDIYKIAMEERRQDYKLWKEQQRDKKAPFFLLYKSFEKEHLSVISGGALKLYVFLGFNVNNFTGECWISTEKIADFFKNDPRTVKKWFKELESLGLIVRIQNGYKRVANTFLLPYGNKKE